MHTSSWKFILIVALLFCTCQVHGGEDKSGKSLSKLSDFKAKLAKSQVSSVSGTISFEDEHIENASMSALGISVPKEYANDTVQFDHHTYYNSTYYADPELGKKFWIDINSYPEPIIHEMLSKSHRQATTVSLKFDFPFYGSTLKNVTIATGGFLYMGDYLHNWIAATQYIAPLMANFDSSQSNDSLIKYADNGTAFTAEWNSIYVQNKMSDGAFTFQVTLFKNGDIVFAYKDIPYPVLNISEANHPVKVGISDAYVLERSLFFVRRKTIYEYHRIDMTKKNVSSNTALYFTALPTCIGYKDCNSCISADPKMECLWCGAVKRCSNGVDRMRQTWVTNGCSLQVDVTCPADVPTTTVASKSVNKGSSMSNSLFETSTETLEKSSMYPSSTYSVERSNQMQEASHYFQETYDSRSVSIGAIVTIVVFVVALLAAAGWIFYAYRFPQTRSGQFLIRYRPSQWALRKDGSAASINNHL